MTGRGRNHTVVDRLLEVPVAGEGLLTAIGLAVRIDHDGTQGVHGVLFENARNGVHVGTNTESLTIGLGHPAGIEVDPRRPVPGVRKLGTRVRRRTVGGRTGTGQAGRVGRSHGHESESERDCAQACFEEHV